MKKFLLKCTAFVLFVGTLVSCSEDKVFYDGSNGPAVVQFTSAEGTFGVSPTRTVKSIPVYASTISNTQRNVVAVIDTIGSSPNIKDFVEIDLAQSFIPAGTYDGNVVVKWKKTYDDITAAEDLVLVLRLTEFQGGSVEKSEKGRFDLTIFKSCDFVEQNVGTSFAGVSESAAGTQLGGFFGPEYTATVTHNTAKPKDFHFDTLWGKNFIGSRFGAQYNGQYVAPATITVNDDLSVVIKPDNGNDYFSGTGTYNACKNVFELTLTQKLYGTPKENTVSVTLTGTPPVQP